jgi:hypothetical protein
LPVVTAGEEERMTAIRLVVFLVAVAGVIPLTAQTHVETLERAIFTEDTLGDLNGAIGMYESLVRTPSVPREVVALAQARLAAVVHRRTSASAAVASSRPFANFGSTAPAQSAERTTPTTAELLEQVNARLDQIARGECCGRFSENYQGLQVTVSGTVTQMAWMNPLAVVFVMDRDGNNWGFTMAAPNSMLLGGMNKNSLKPGEEVLVYGYRATGTGQGCPQGLPTSCATLGNGALHASASTIVSDDGQARSIFDRAAAERLEAERLLEQQRALQLKVQQGL